MSNEFEQSQRLQQYLIEIIERLQKDEEHNQVRIDTNLERNVPEKDIHKIAGPFIDEWVYETLKNEAKDENSNIQGVVSKQSSSLEDVFLKLELDGEQYDILIDVKSASLAKGSNAGKGSNLTSFRKIRPFYVNNPNAFFFILSIEHKNIIENDKCHGFELVGCNIFDLKYVSDSELKFNTSMGDQFQISNSMHVTQVDRTTKDFIALIDNMFLAKYSKEKLQKLIEEELAQENIRKVAHILFEIIKEYEPIKKANIFLHFERMVKANVDEKVLEKALKNLKDGEQVTTVNRRDYILYRNEE